MCSGLVAVKCQTTEEGHISVPANPLPYIATAAELLSNTYPEPDQILQNFADKGTKIALISMSKGRKSWFLLQMAIALATGIPKFLGWSIPRARKVLLIQFEIPELHFAKRLSKLTDSLKVNKPDIESNLLIANWRGGSFNLLSSVHSNNLIQFIKDNGIEVLIFDPLYKILPGGENSPEDIKPVLNTFDKLCEETGVALFYSHHAPKGISGDRPGIDASSGSGVIGRDMDGQITLFQHVQADLQVVDIISRLYPCLDPFSVRFCPDSCLFEASQELPHVLTSKNKNFRRSNAVKKSLTKDQMLSLADPPLAWISTENN